MQVYDELAQSICAILSEDSVDIDELYMLIFNHFSSKTPESFRRKLWTMLERYVSNGWYKRSDIKQDIDDFILLSQLHSKIS